MSTEYSAEEIHGRLLAMAKDFHKTCVNNNLKYYMLGGTMLGAVRHKGFIPWDDDMDICMPREDYEKFCKAFCSEDKRYYILDTTNTYGYFNNISRACDGNIILKAKDTEDIPHFGAFVDIYLLDRWPSDEKESAEFTSELIQAMKNTKYALPWKIYRTAPFRRKMKMIVHFRQRIKNHLIVGYKKRIKEKDELMIKYNDSYTGYRNFCSGSTKKIQWLMREEDMDKRILHKFEDIEVYIPENYDELLTRRYGDYMTLPPASEQIPHHHYIPYWNPKIAKSE